ncbi:phosphatase PAP2 family protein [Streptomyces sp. ISL-96]|uniref:phosphatase PAP2 family protein n=1 Tax=Streptomyces sp. ISL-96 TaxID=2819191 RepID=UPI001BE5E3DF|nr:phosphatase PAP2 family protein [Streptomyces sp. ISL-96]MBT2489905.1 phosphatase PAP2 family protein [Streptomyces sp. ISL-96]
MLPALEARVSDRERHLVLNSSPQTDPPPRSGRPPGHPVPAAPPRGALVTGTVLLLGVLAIGLMLRAGGAPAIQNLDDRWARWAQGPRSEAATDFTDILDRLGGPLGLIFPLVLVGCLCVYGRWRSGLFVFVACVVANMLVVLPLKSLVGRPRPPHPLVLVNDGSYPSGQVFTAVALVMVVAVVLFRPDARRWWWAFGGVYVATMMWSRVWLHAQWLSDTVAGAVAGIGTCLLLWRAFAPLLEREAVRAATNRLW